MFVSGHNADTKALLIMAQAQDDKLDDKTVRDLAPPVAGNKITYDSEVKGFGVRVTKAGAKAFILNYRQGRTERRITIGSFPDWTVKKAREHAKALKRQVDAGADPMADRHADRAAPTIETLADRFEKEHLSKRRVATQADYRSILTLYIRPSLGRLRVDEVRHTDIERLHATVAKRAPYRANRTVSVLSKMLTLAIKWEMRTDNPARGIERAPEQKRERYLSPAEIARLSEALAGLREQDSANAIRLLLLTGARKSEVLKARWSEFNLTDGVWIKPSAHVKTKKDHRVPLSGPARLLLTEMREKAEKALDPGESLGLVFEGARGKPLSDIRESWAAVCLAAGLGAQVEVKGKDGKPEKVWKADARMHDLRHTYASILASSGLSLPIIGQLLGHTQAQTTQRYAHLMDDPLREATERVGAAVTAGKNTNIVQLDKVRA
jgi:integrase